MTAKILPFWVNGKMNVRVEALLSSLSEGVEKRGWREILDYLKRNVKFPFKCPVCSVKHRSLESQRAKNCIYKLWREYQGFFWVGRGLRFELIWELARRRLPPEEFPRPPEVSCGFWKDWMIAVDQRLLREAYLDWKRELQEKAKRMEKKWNLKMEGLMEKISESEVDPSPMVWFRRGTWSEIKELIVNGVEIDPDLLCGMAVKRAGLPPPHADFDDKGRGDALNYDLYAVDPVRNIVIIQQREWHKYTRKGSPRVYKKYYVVDLNTGRCKKIHPSLRKVIEKAKFDASIPSRIASLVEAL